MSGYTKGPWVIDALNVGTQWNVDTEAGYSICMAHDVSYEDIQSGRKERAANATLISAAPELLEALDGCLNYIEWINPDKEEHPQQFLLDNARKAIAKAKGEI